MKLGKAVTLHPLIVSAVYIAYVPVMAISTNVAAAAFRTSEPEWTWIVLEVILTFAAVLVTALWVFATIRVSAEQLSKDVALQPATWFVVIFLLCGIAATLLVFPYRLGAYAQMERNPAVITTGIAGVASYFVAAWLAASLLVKAEFKTGKSSSTFVTFLLLLYLVVGVWILRPRILRLQHDFPDRVPPAF